MGAEGKIARLVMMQINVSSPEREKRGERELERGWISPFQPIASS
jgi:hypothetical protein